MKVQIKSYVTGYKDPNFDPALKYPYQKDVLDFQAMFDTLTVELSSMLPGNSRNIQEQAKNFAYAMWNGCDKFQAINRLDNGGFAVLEVERID